LSFYLAIIPINSYSYTQETQCYLCTLSLSSLLRKLAEFQVLSRLEDWTNLWATPHAFIVAPKQNEPFLTFRLGETLWAWFND